MLVTVDKLKGRLDLFGISGDRELETEFFDIWSDSDYYDNATVEVDPDYLTLNIEQGDVTTTLEYPKQFELGSYTSVSDLISDIESFGPWHTILYVRADADASSVKPMLLSQCLGYQNRVAVNGSKLYQLTSTAQRASDFVEEQCNRKFEQDDHVEEISGIGEPNIYIDNYPIQSITSIEKWDGTSWDDVDSDSYRYEDGTGRIYVDSGVWANGFQNYRVSYSGGFSTIPFALEDLVLEIAALMWNKVGTDPRVSREKIGSYRTEYIEDFLPSELEGRLSYWERKDYV